MGGAPPTRARGQVQFSLADIAYDKDVARIIAHLPRPAARPADPVVRSGDGSC